jgi:arylsulfatase A-like enzyme
MSSQRNVLFIIADQFRADCLGAAGNPIIKTPNLDGLARDGCLFSHAFIQTTPCGPSRMSIFNSRYLCSTRVVENMTPLVDADDNLAMALRQEGYAPALVGYNDYAIDPRILPTTDPRANSLNYDNVLPGFDWVLNHTYDSSEYFSWLRKKGYPEYLLSHDAIHKHDVPAEGPGDHLPLHYPARYRAEDSEGRFLTQTALDWIHGQSQQWFLSLNYIKPHPPRICAAPYHRMYDPAALPPANRRAEELNDDHPHKKFMHQQPKLVSERDLRETKACYYGMISELDACLGILFDDLKRSGRWNDTLIVFTSDHGEYLGDHYLLDKAHFYDETLRVPMIVREPSPAADATRGRKISGFVESIDTAPTILEFASIAPPDRFQGRSLLPVLRGESTSLRSEIFYEDDFRDPRRLPNVDPERCLLWVVRDHDYKYVQFAEPSMRPFLFDLQNDPGEQIDVAGKPEHARTVAEYCQRLLRWRMKHEDQRMERWAAKYR